MRQLTVEELKKRLDNGENVNIVDVREDSERADFNIGGRHLRLGLIQNMETSDIEDLKNEEVIVYCRSGQRSQMACYLLEQAGFTNTVNLKGGVLDWINKYGR